MNLKNQYVFHSISELVEKLDKAKHIEGRQESSNDERSGTWSDTNSYSEAREYLLGGKEYNLSSDVDKYKSKGSGIKSKSYLDVVGHQVVVPLYLQGIPNSMVNKTPVINNKIVTIVYDCSAPYYVNKDDILKTTKKLFEKIVKLEKDGYRCNVWVIETNDNDNGKWGFALRLKTDREVLNMKKMMFPLISPSFLRRIGFRLKERLYKDWIGSGYGRASFDIDLVDKFIKKNLRLRNYEVWNYEGKQN